MIFKYVPYVTVAHVFWRRWKLWVFWKKECFFFSKEHLKVFKNTKHGYFPLECLSNFISAYATFKRSKIEFFSQKTTILRKILERLQEPYLALFIAIACQTFILLRNFRNNQIFGFFWKNRCCFWKDFFFRNR